MRPWASRSRGVDSVETFGFQSESTRPIETARPTKNSRDRDETYWKTGFEIETELDCYVILPDLGIYIFNCSHNDLLCVWCWRIAESVKPMDSYNWVMAYLVLIRLRPIWPIITGLSCIRPDTICARLIRAFNSFIWARVHMQFEFWCIMKRHWPRLWPR